MVHFSWTYCEKWKRLLEQKLMPNYAKRPMLKLVKQCNCTEKRYIIPAMKDVPKELKNLTMQQIYALIKAVRCTLRGSEKEQ